MVCEQLISQFTTIQAEYDVYPCDHHGCSHFHQVIEEKKLWSAMRYLQLSRVRQLLAEMGAEQVIAWRSSYQRNLLEHVISQLSSYNNNKHKPNLDVITFSPFDFIRNLESIELATQLIEELARNYPVLITNRVIERVLYRLPNVLLKIFRNYRRNQDEEKICYICYSDDDLDLLKNPCGCHNYVHLTCLNELINERDSTICPTCQRETGAIKYTATKICYPALNIYPTPLLTGRYDFLAANNRSQALHYACLYLCVNKVQEILSEMTAEDFRNYLLTLKVGTYFHSFNQQGHLILAPINVPSNLSRTDYPEQYAAIDQLLSQKHSSLNQ